MTFSHLPSFAHLPWTCTSRTNFPYIFYKFTHFRFSYSPRPYISKKLRQLQSDSRILLELDKGTPVPFLITESRKIIWPFHASREIQNKISRSRKSQNSNSRGRKIYFIPRITNHEKIKFSITRHGKSIGDPLDSYAFSLHSLEVSWQFSCKFANLQPGWK